MKNFFNETDILPSVSSFKHTNDLSVKHSMTASSTTNYDNFVDVKTRSAIPHNFKIRNRGNSYVFKEKPYEVSRIVEKIGKHNSLKEMPVYLSTSRNVNKTRSYKSSEYIQLSEKGIKKHKKHTPKKEVCVPQIYNRNFKHDLILSKSKRVRHKKNQNIDRNFGCCDDVEYNWSARNLNNTGHLKNRGKTSKSDFAAKEKKREFNDSLQPHDIWAMLKKMNRFQFKATPVLSQESVITAKKKITSRKRSDKARKKSVLETCSSTEVAYISSICVNARSRKTITPSSSTNEVKVIDMNDFNEPFNPSSKKKVCSSSNRLIQCTEVGRKQISYKRGGKNVYPKSTEINYMAIKKEIGDHLVRRQTRNRKMYTNYRSNRKDSDAIVNKHDKFIPIEDLLLENNMTGNCKTRQDDGMSITTNSEPTSNNRGSKAIHSLSTPRTILLDPCRNPDNVPVDKDLTQRKICSPAIQRKQRFVTTMPSTIIDSKITTKEVRQRIANIKFPFVILRKDQLSSNFHVYRYEAPQFIGLDEHIWPFMIEWIENKDVLDKNIIDQRIPIRRVMRISKKQNEPDITKHPIVHSKIKWSLLENNKHNSNKKEKSHKPGQKQKRYLQYDIEQKKIKDRNEMIKLLFQKCSALNSDLKNQREYKQEISDQIYNVNSISIDNVTEVKSIKKEAAVAVKVVPKTKKNDSETVLNEIPLSPYKQIKDSAESIIRKVNDGAYYKSYGKSTRHTTKNRRLEKNRSINESTMSMEFPKQKEINTYDEEQLLDNGQANGLSIKEQRDMLLSIPGFNEPLPPLQIETVGVDTLNIKHHLTNTTVQFEIAVQKQSNTLEDHCQLYNCMPIYDPKSNSQVFKCKKVIFNGELPTEICTILPSLMEGIQRGEQLDDLSSNAIHSNMKNELSGISKKAEIALTPLRKGSFASNASSYKRKEVCLRIKFDDMFTLFSKQSTKNFLLYISPWHSIASIAYTPIQKSLSLPTDFMITPMAVQMRPTISNTSAESMETLNESKNKLLINNVNINVDKHCLDSKSSILNVYVKPKKILCDFDSGFSLSKGITQDTKSDDLMRSLTTSAIINAEADYNNDIKCSSAMNNANTKLEILLSTRTNFNIVSENISKGYCKIYYKNRGLTKLHKSNSTSVLSTNKNKITVNEITNLEDFLKVLGLETMAEIFDKKHEEKILSSVIQLRSWIAEISPKQALLILLLCNKKQTSNMLQFWSTILKGIARKKITCASELDAKVELIENEDFYKSPKCEEFYYLPASEENRKSILEEMYCIAKNAASDYRISLDDSYKIALKSFVSKQRKLNPRYLKVMARLTGLGLLNKTLRSSGQREVDN